MLYGIRDSEMNNELIKDIVLNKHSYVCYFQFETFKEYAEKLGIHDDYVTELSSNQFPAIEFYDTSNIISLQIPHEVNEKHSFSHVYIYMRKNLLIFICKKHLIIEKLIEEISTTELKNENTLKVLYLFLSRLIMDDNVIFEDIEKEIADIEETLITSQKSDCIKTIIRYRKKLMIFKTYYNQLLNITEGLSENDNNLLEGGDFRLFKQLTNRINRLYNYVISLREYVTQVREAYQTQMDINLNSVMKLFTVITVIFMPLTVLVGWYGMNLRMPEFNSAYAYPIVIAISVLIVVGEIIYFIKNKWF